MNRSWCLALMSSCLICLAGCADEAFNRGMYEGFRAQKDALRPVDVGNVQGQPDFDRYDAERRKLHPEPADATLEVPATTRK